MILATCRLCRQIVKAAAVKAPGNGGSVTENPDLDQQRAAFSAAFGEHIRTHHPAEFQGLQALLLQCSAAGSQVAGFVALRNAESADPEFQAWRQADAEQILKGIEELRQMVQPV